MSSLDLIVNVQVSQQTQAVPQAGFGIPLILGSSNRFSERIRYYLQPQDALADGFSTSDPEYIHLVEAFEQDLAPTQVGIGRRLAAVAQVDHVTVATVADSTNYSLTINGVQYQINSGVGATQDSILNALKAAVDAALLPLTLAVSSHILSITANVPGNAFTDLGSANLLVVNSVANHGVAEDIADVQAVSDLWYGLVLTSKAKDDILNAAAYIESQKKIFIAATADSDVITSASTDVGSLLKGKNYKRSGILYSSHASEGPDAAWVGGQLPNVPGSSTWKFKTLIGIDADKITATQRNILIGTPGNPGKNVNIYEQVGGVDITEEGFMSGGQFIDVTVGIDWLESTIQTNVYALLVQNSKVPYTDKGASIVENAVRQSIQQGINNGLIDGASGFTVEVPKVLSIPANIRAERLLPGVKFQCRLAGAFHFIQINGVVTV